MCLRYHNTNSLIICITYSIFSITIWVVELIIIPSSNKITNCGVDIWIVILICSIVHFICAVTFLIPILQLLMGVLSTALSLICAIIIIGISSECKQFIVDTTYNLWILILIESVIFLVTVVLALCIPVVIMMLNCLYCCKSRFILSPIITPTSTPALSPVNSNAPSLIQTPTSIRIDHDIQNT